MITLLRFNQEPLKFPSFRLLSARPSGTLIDVEYLDDKGNQLHSFGYFLEQH